MSTDAQQMEQIAGQVQSALQSAGLSAYKELLDPNVTWGAPDDSIPACRNRDQVLTWYRQGRAKGVRADVIETLVQGDRILVALMVGNEVAADTGGSPRWQVLTVKDGLVTDIRGFEDRASAISRMG